VLVSETMLQQTQVATVVPYFHRFIERFPTVQSLARADDQDVLRAWQGLGYYSRARNLQRAARMIVSEHDGQVPDSIEALRKLPGVGRYTAGAVASIAFGCRAPIVDGNVARVLCRLDKIQTDPRETETAALLWRRAEQILPRTRCGDFNSALMELGATVCTPRMPACLVCPMRDVCEAFAAGIQNEIPRPRTPTKTPLLRRDVICVRHPARTDRWLIEQRPDTGRWAGMWQFVTLPTSGSAPSAQTLQSSLSLVTDPPRLIGSATHTLTHRRYAFDVYVCTASPGHTATTGPRRWVTWDELDGYPLPRPHLKVLAMLQAT
jgi:A/G-specific adenine glycosylase